MCQLDRFIHLPIGWGCRQQFRDFEIYICFGFDESKHTHQPQIPFNLIVGVINIFRCVSILKIPAHEPLGQYYQQNSTITRLCDKDVRDILCVACVWAYPNLHHYCHVNIDGLVAHSNCFTAVLFLHLGGANIAKIAFCLWWEPGSMPTYLREWFVGIDTIIQKVIAGAYLTIWPIHTFLSQAAHPCWLSSPLMI